MGKSIIADKSFEFAVRIVKLYKFLCDNRKEFVLSKQLLRSGTSIGANVREALQANSRKDFLYKMNISLKEAHETQYWIELLYATGYINDKQNKSIYDDCSEIVGLLVSIVKTTKTSLEVG